MVGGTIPPQSDSGEISRVLVLNLLWQSKRCSRTAQDISVLTTPSLLSRGTRRQGQSTEYTEKIRYGPGSHLVNRPLLIFVSASSKEGIKQWPFVRRSFAKELHERGEHSGEVLAEKVTTSKPTSCLREGWTTSVGNDGSGAYGCQPSPSNSLSCAS